MRGNPFRNRPDAALEARLAEVEATVIRRLAVDLAQAVREPDEPSMRRLFPPAYLDDDRLQEQFASLTRDELLEGKIAAARAVADSIDAGALKRGRWSGVLDEETAGCWLRVLNDARLVLGTRLDVTEDMESLADDDPSTATMNLYLWLGWLEEMLIDALAGRLPDETGTEG